MAAILKLQVRTTKYFVCMYGGGGHLCINIPNMKFLCLILWQVEVCTDADADANDDGQSLIVEGSLVDKRNEPKKTSPKLWKQFYFLS